MSKDNVMRLSDSEKRFIEYLRNYDAFKIRELYNQLDSALLKAKIYVAEEENITRKEAEAKDFTLLKELIDEFENLSQERKSEALKRIT